MDKKPSSYYPGQRSVETVTWRNWWWFGVARLRTGPDQRMAEALRSSIGCSDNVETMNWQKLQSTGMSEFLQELPTPEGGKEGCGWIDQQDSGWSNIPWALSWMQSNLGPGRGQRNLRRVTKVCWAWRTDVVGGREKESQRERRPWPKTDLIELRFPEPSMSVWVTSPGEWTWGHENSATPLLFFWLFSPRFHFDTSCSFSFL